jgi:hypothetical protein
VPRHAATDVIRDRFFVAFLDPDHDLSIVDPTLLRDAKRTLRLPAEGGENLVGAGSLRPRPEALARPARRRLPQVARRARPGPRLPVGGRGSHPGALLTVFRNYDNAMVLEGWWGPTRRPSG